MKHIMYCYININYCIFSALKLIDMCSISSHLGPLQLSLKRIMIDIVKFFTIYSLVLFSFACGLNQLIWYFADLEQKKCNDLKENRSIGELCSKWKNHGKWVRKYSPIAYWITESILIELNVIRSKGILSMWL